MFIGLAYEHWPRDEVRARWDALTDAEAEILAKIEWGPRVHSTISIMGMRWASPAAF
jgi:hypothetical protein